MPFEIGEWVFLASAGVVRLVDFASRGPDGKPAPWRSGNGVPDFYVVSNEEVTACVPVATANETLRSLVSSAVAQQMLDCLRADAAPVPEPMPLLVRGKEVVHSGSPLDHARFLRELYSLPEPLSASLQEGVRFFEKLVLPEIAQVLGMSVPQIKPGGV